MVEEFDVLLRVQRLQQRRGRIALVAAAELVNLVEHDHRVHHLDILECLHQLAGQRADVGATVTLDFRLIAHPADAETIERPAEGFGDGLADTGLAHARRADQQHNGAGDLALESADGEKLENAVLDVIETGMVLVEHLARALEVELVLAVHPPGQGGGPVEVVAGDGVFRRAGLEDRQLVQFLVDALLRGGRHYLAFQARAELVGIGALVVLGDTQLALDDLQLFLEEELALALANLAIHLAGQLLLQPGDFHFLAQQRQHLLHALQDRHGIQHFLQLYARRGGQRGGEVRQWRWVVGAEAIEVVLQLLAVQRVERQELLDRVDQGHAVGLHLVTRVVIALRIIDFHQIRRLAPQPAADAHPRQPLGDELQLAAFLRGVVHADHGAVLRQAVRVEGGHVQHRRVYEEQCHALVRRLGHALQGFCPGVFVDDHR